MAEFYLNEQYCHLTWLLRQGAFRPALEYRPMLDTLADDLRATWSWLRVFWPTCGRAAAAPILQGWAECTLTQQPGQVVDVSAEGRDFCAGRDEGREVVCAIRAGRQHWHAGHRARDAVAGWEHRGFGSQCDCTGLVSGEAK